MVCSKCGKKVSVKDKFCSVCGNAMTEIEEPQSGTKREVIFEGKIHKCPNCGSTLKSFEHKCENCGYELRSSINSGVVKTFAEKLRKTKSIFDKNELISNFYIPNTKEDIYEFFILANTNLMNDVKCEEAWKAKLEQTYQKAKLSFGNTTEFEYIDELYKKTLKTYKNIVFKRKVETTWKLILGSSLVLIGLVISIWGGFEGAETGDGDSPYYMLTVFGMLIIFGGVGLYINVGTKKANAKRRDDE